MYLVFPVAGFLYVILVRNWTIPKYVIFLIVGIFGLISLAALALMFTGSYSVVITENESRTYPNGTAIESIDHSTPIIDSQLSIWGWIFAALAIIWGLLYFYVSLLPWLGGLQ